MKKLFPLAIVIACFIIAYVVSGIIVWDFNPGHWSALQRLLMIVVGVALLYLIWLNGARKQSHDEFQARRQERFKNKAE